MEVIVKRGRGRPKGSKNKVKAEKIVEKACEDVKTGENKEGTQE